MRNWVLLLVTIICTSILSATAQKFTAQPIKGLPSEEVYDLLADSKGFLWAAHSLGLSRYDGISFKDFNHPDATGAGVTDLVEDKQGRIWCHNFNGQVFYIENEQIHLLEAYKYKEESFYPRMLILNDELLITSQKGLFVLNTATMTSKMLINGLKKDSTLITTRGIAQVKGVAYLFNNENIYKYDPKKKRLIQMYFLNNTSYDFALLDYNGQLQPIESKDTIYSKFGQSDIYKFTVSNDSLVLENVTHESSHVNTIINSGDKIWINTANESYTRDKNLSILGLNLTDIVIDANNNTWYSSLNKGIFLSAKHTFWSEKQLKGISENNSIRCYFKIGTTQLYGTQNGEILIKENNAIKINKVKLPLSSGPVEQMYWLTNNVVLVAASVGIYSLELKTQKISSILESRTLKDISIVNNLLLLAYSNSLSLIRPKKKESFLDKLKEKSNYNTDRILRGKRCYSITFNTTLQKTLLAFNDGLFELQDTICTPVLYQNKTIPASSLLTIGDKTFVTTFNKGLFIVGKKGIALKSTADGLLSNKILKLKQIDGQLYIIEQKNMQVMDVATEQIIKSVSLPIESAGIIYDVWREDSLLYVSSNKNLYTLRTSSLSDTIVPFNYLLSVTNDTNTFPINHALELPYYQNNLHFKVISPSFIYPEFTYFKYRIKGSGDTTWQQTTTNESNIAFAALKPGNYAFEAYAVNFQNINGKLIKFDFTIKKPWWLQWWFLGVNMVVLVAIATYLVKLRLATIKRKNDQVLEKLSLNNELRKSQLATIVSQMNPHFIFNALNTIQGLIYNNKKEDAGEHIGKFSELVRNVLENSNNETITLGEEVYHLKLYLELEKMRFEEELHIEIVVDELLDQDNIMIPPILIQPYIENAIVHGLFHKNGDKNLTVYFKNAKKENYLEIKIDDNGIGRTSSNQINQKRKKHTSFAISAIEKRISLINQTLTDKIELEIIDKQLNEQALGTTVIILIPVLDK